MRSLMLELHAVALTISEMSMLLNTKQWLVTGHRAETHIPSADMQFDTPVRRSIRRVCQNALTSRRINRLVRLERSEVEISGLAKCQSRTPPVGEAKNGRRVCWRCPNIDAIGLRFFDSRSSSAINYDGTSSHHVVKRLSKYYSMPKYPAVASSHRACQHSTVQCLIERLAWFIQRAGRVYEVQQDPTNLLPHGEL